ncbi:hypothetical protein ES705_48602 [subsurface metagenome]
MIAIHTLSDKNLIVDFITIGFIILITVLTIMFLIIDLRTTDTPVKSLK